MVGKQEDRLVITRSEFWILKDVLALAKGQIRALQGNGVNAFGSTEEFIRKLYEKMELIEGM